MTDKTFTFTIDQIKDIYQAGVRRGEEVQSSYDWGPQSYACDWGSNSTGGEFDYCVSAMHDMVNQGVDMFDPNYTDYDTVVAWFK
jgi:hypothetical protein